MAEQLSSRLSIIVIRSVLDLPLLQLSARLHFDRNLTYLWLTTSWSARSAPKDPTRHIVNNFLKSDCATMLSYAPLWAVSRVARWRGRHVLDAGQTRIAETAITANLSLVIKKSFTSGSKSDEWWTLPVRAFKWTRVNDSVRIQCESERLFGLFVSVWPLLPFLLWHLFQCSTCVKLSMSNRFELIRETSVCSAVSQQFDVSLFALFTTLLPTPSLPPPPVSSSFQTS
jgi:hypothetical protein